MYSCPRRLSLFIPVLLSLLILLLAPGPAESAVGIVGHKRFLAVRAQAKGIFLVRQREAEHHLYAAQQGMEIPNDHGLIVI